MPVYFPEKKLPAGTEQVLAKIKLPQIDFAARVVPPGLPALAMQLVGWGPSGPVCVPNDAISAAIAYNASIVNPNTYYFKPSTGSDAAAGTRSAPFASASYAMKTAPNGSRVAALEDCVIAAFDIRSTDPSQTVGPQFKWLDANGFNVVMRDSGPDLSTQTFAQDATNTSCYTTTLTLAGTSALTRVLRLDQFDGEGEPKQLTQYASAALLNAAVQGYYYDAAGKVLWINLGGANVHYLRGALKALYSGSAGNSRVMASGTKVGFSGVRFEGVQFIHIDAAGRRPEVWLHECEVMYALAKGVDMSNAGWLVNTDTLFYASKQDNVNAYAPGATGKGLVHSVRSRFSSAGDRTVFAADGTLQGTSAHGGSDHIAWGCTFESSNGQGVADTCIATYNDVSWLVGCRFNRQSGNYPSMEFGSAASSASRKAYIDTCVSVGPWGADLVIGANATIYAYSTDLPTITGGAVTAYNPSAPS